MIIILFSEWTEIRQEIPYVNAIIYQYDASTEGICLFPTIKTTVIRQVYVACIYWVEDIHAWVLFVFVLRLWSTIRTQIPPIGLFQLSLPDKIRSGQKLSCDKHGTQCEVCKKDYVYSRSS